MKKYRIDKAMENVRKLEPITRLPQLSPQQRTEALQQLAAIGWDRILADLEYLMSNLPKGDPRLPGVEALLPIVRKATRHLK